MKFVYMLIKFKPDDEEYFDHAVVAGVYSTLEKAVDAANKLSAETSEGYFIREVEIDREQIMYVE